MHRININAIDKMLTRETANRDSVPAGTIDWYTYQNRIDLLNEVKGHTEEVVKPEKEDSGEAVGEGATQVASKAKKSKVEPKVEETKDAA